MKNELPEWWPLLSGLFFLVNILFFAVLIYVLVKVLKIMQELEPKVVALSGQVQQLIVKVDRVADRVEEVAESVKDTVQVVGGRAKGVAGAVDLVVQSTSRQFERFAPLVTAAMTGVRLFNAYREYRHGHEEAAAKKTTKSLLGRKK